MFDPDTRFKCVWRPRIASRPPSRYVSALYFLESIHTDVQQQISIRYFGAYNSLLLRDYSRWRFSAMIFVEVVLTVIVEPAARYPLATPRHPEVRRLETFVELD